MLICDSIIRFKAIAYKLLNGHSDLHLLVNCPTHNVSTCVCVCIYVSVYVSVYVCMYVCIRCVLDILSIYITHYDLAIIICCVKTHYILSMLPVFVPMINYTHYIVGVCALKHCTIYIVVTALYGFTYLQTTLIHACYLATSNI